MADRRDETVRGLPAPALAPYVEGYLGYRLTGAPPGLHRGLPSRRPTFIVSIGAPVDVVEQTDPTQHPATYRCVVGGLQATPALIAHGGDQEGVAVDLTPEGCRALFGLPARALWNTSVELDDVERRVGGELWERMQHASSWSERFATCDDVLGRMCDPSRSSLPAELRRCWQLLEQSSGSVGVREVAAEVGWSRQHLGRRFAGEFGLSPKLAARVIRFDRARHALQAGVAAFRTISEVAAACGYYDQAHLDREFAELARCTPTQLLAGDVPSVQDAALPPSRR